MSIIASGERIVSHFKEFDHDQAAKESWEQGETVLDWHVTDMTTIQGILCCVDQDTTKAWLLMIVDSHPNEVTISYLVLTYGSWQWAWVHAEDNLAACHEFINWLELNKEIPT